MSENIQERFNNLPADVKEAITSNNSQQILQDIGLEKGLHIDQIGILEEETMLVMLGVSHPENFVDRIEDRLNLTSEKAIDIATAVNVQIFLPVRESLMKIHESPAEESQAETVSESKEDILAEIEKPTPRTASQGDHDAAHEFIGSALSGNVAMPAQRAHIEMKKVPPEKATAQEKPRTYAADPYREPIN